MANKIYKIPSHIAIIMDGNGRWATKRGLPRNYGHREGVKAIERTIDACLKYGIRYCTFFAFSTENWKRSKEEIDGIFELLREYLRQNNDSFFEKGVKISYLGVIDPFPEDLKKALLDTMDKTKDFNKLEVNFAINYGGRDDIVRAVNNLIQNGYTKITESDLLNALDTKNLPEPDFVIRTSGEMRISNFLLYQMAYSELYFPKVLWPDFNKKYLLKALKVYQNRNRRFGGIKWKLDYWLHLELS